MEITLLLVAIFIYITWMAKEYRMRHADYVPGIDDWINHYLVDLTYYQDLSEPGKTRFRQRTRIIYNKKNFKGIHGLKVTKEMKVRLSASITQLTYGYSEFEIPHFDEIWIFPKVFYHPVHKANMKGFTAPNGTIAVSWPDYLHGYQVEDDNYNLGLHELAHALHVNNSHSVDNKYFRRHFKIWSERSLTDFYDLRSGHNSFLRKYGGNNFHEFFAVCVEHFFESPKAFYKRMPNLYIRTCILLAQNPLNTAGDFAFEPEDITTMDRNITQ